MQAIMLVTTYNPDDSYEGKNGRVHRKVLTLLEAKQSGGLGTQFYTTEVDDETLKMFGGSPEGKRVKLQFDVIRQLFAGQARLADAKVLEVLK